MSSRTKHSHFTFGSHHRMKSEMSYCSTWSKCSSKKKQPCIQTVNNMHEGYRALHSVIQPASQLFCIGFPSELCAGLHIVNEEECQVPAGVFRHDNGMHALSCSLRFSHFRGVSTSKMSQQPLLQPKHLFTGRTPWGEGMYNSFKLFVSIHLFTSLIRSLAHNSVRMQCQKLLHLQVVHLTREDNNKKHTHLFFVCVV